MSKFDPADTERGKHELEAESEEREHVLHGRRIVRSDNHSNHGLPIGTLVRPADPPADTEAYYAPEVQWWTQGIVGDEVAIHPLDLSDDSERTTTDEELAAAVADCKREILDDMCTTVSSRSDKMPLTVSSFSELHDYVDANTYAGFCGPEDPGEPDRRDWSTGDLIAMQNRVHEWLASGQAAREKIAMWLYERYGPAGPILTDRLPWHELRDSLKARWLFDAGEFLHQILDTDITNA